MVLTVFRVATIVVEGRLREFVRRRRTHREDAGVRDHVIVCGCRRVGLSVASEFACEGAQLVAVGTADALHELERVCS